MPLLSLKFDIPFQFVFVPEESQNMQVGACWVIYSVYQAEFKLEVTRRQGIDFIECNILLASDVTVFISAGEFPHKSWVDGVNCSNPFAC